MSHIFRYADLDAVVALSLKQACKQILYTVSPARIRQALAEACIDSLFVYRKFCAANSSPGQLILPEPLKLLPLCTLGMIKHALFHSGQLADERAFLYAYVASMPCYVSRSFVTPRLWSLLDIPDDTCMYDSDGRVYLPPLIELSSKKIAADGIYLLDDSRALYMWIGDNVPSDAMKAIFDVDPAEGKINPNQLQVTTKYFDDPTHPATRIHVLLSELRKNQPHFPNLNIIMRVQHSAREAVKASLLGPTLDERDFFKHLIEDDGGLVSYSDLTKEQSQKDVSLMSYIDFLVYIHKNIQDKFYQ